MTATRLAILAVALSAPLVTSLHAQWLHQPTIGIPRTADGRPNLGAPAPRTPDGKPDLSGLWNKLSPKYARNIAADLKPGEIQPWAEALVQKRKEDLGKDYMNVLCVPLGPAYSTDADSTGAEMIKIVQTPGLILILNPDLTYRQIFLDGRALETAPNPSWMGYSVGHWDGDTLVVESFGFNDRTWLDHDGHPHTEALRMTERYRRRNFGNLEVDVTLSDPAVYARPWTVSGPRRNWLLSTEMIEWVCNEKGSELQHWVGKASDEKKSEVKVAPDVLAKYVGTYEEQAPLTGDWGPACRRDHGLGQYSVCSPTWTDGERRRWWRSPKRLFSGLYGLGVEFIRNERGEGASCETRVRRLPVRTKEVAL